MKRIFFLILLLFLTFSLCGCSTVVPAEEGKYICETPYITFTMKYGEQNDIDEIEINQTVYKCRTLGGGGPDNTITYYQYKENYPKNMYPNEDMILAEFRYSFNTKNKKLSLTDKRTGNVYHLDKKE